MAPAAKRKIEEGDANDSKRNATKDVKTKRKPVVINSIQFDRSFKLLEKKFMNSGKPQIAPRLDAPRLHRKVENQGENTNQTASTSQGNNEIDITNDEMEGDWTEPKKTIKIAQMTPQSNSIKQTNKFEALGSQTQPEDTPRHQEEQTTNKEKKYKPPPITVYNSTIKIIIQLINKHELGNGNIRIKQTNGLDNTINIQTNALEIYEKTIKALREGKIEFYTYTPKNTKVKSIVLKGVRGEFTEENVLNELKNNNYNNVNIIKISKINFDKENTNRYHFLVQLTHESHLSELTRTKYILYQAVKWEHLRKRKIFQCKNCQRLGHASTNCNLKYRCVKCSQNHTPGECTIKEKTECSSLKCANCGQSGHPASYRGCPYIKNATMLVQNAKRNKQRLINNKISSIERKVTPGLSYAAIASTTAPNAPTVEQNTHLTAEINAQNIKDNHTETITTPTKINTNETPAWVNLIRQEMTSIVSKLANIEKKLTDDHCRINNLFEILQEIAIQA